MAQGVEKLAAEKFTTKEFTTHELIAKQPDVKNQGLENRMPTRLSAAIFKGKALLLQLRREAQNRTSGLQRYSSVGTDSEAADFTEIVAESRTPLFTEAQPAERVLQLGKVQNLRRAIRHLNGIVIPAGAVFSFWKQVGRATKARGYVAGRQLQEGCLFPAIGGGLCQLSNALYDVALQADCEIIERHPHTRIIPGSAAARGRDAAIAWNYIDLRFRPSVPLRLELTLTRTELIVRLKATTTLLQDARKQYAAPSPVDFISLASLAKSLSPASSHMTPDSRPILKAQDHSCVTCGVESCFRQDTSHVRTLRQEAQRGTPVGRTAYLVDTLMPEFAAYLENQSFQDRSLQDRSLNASLQNQQNAEAILFLPLDGTRWNQPRYAWPTSSYAHVYTAAWVTLQRAFSSRAIIAVDGRARRLAQIDGAERLAANFARALPWQMPSPMEPLSRSSLPFDANWNAHQVTTSMTNRIAFPGPTHARKGAYELRAVARAMNLEVVLTGSELEGNNFWQGLTTRHVSAGNASGTNKNHDSSQGDWLNGVGVVVRPAVVEEKPRLLLEALARGIPVIATSACGLGDMPGVTTIPVGDEEALCEAIVTILFKTVAP